MPYVTTLLSNANVVLTPFAYLNTKQKVQCTKARRVEEVVDKKVPALTNIACSSYKAGHFHLYSSLFLTKQV